MARRLVASHLSDTPDGYHLQVQLDSRFLLLGLQSWLLVSTGYGLGHADLTRA